MSLKPPFIAQERFDACALACLRMLLADQGTYVTEAQLLEMTSFEAGGMNPAELAVLAKHFGLKAEPVQIDIDTIVEHVRHERFPIVLVDRSVLDDEFAVHALIPFRFSAAFVRVLDPLRGERRISRRKFEQAHRRVGRWAVVWDLQR
jgi:ABC-type bacteriocin/lantibiotic exporter with double-glycine peptidase domain